MRAWLIGPLFFAACSSQTSEVEQDVSQLLRDPDSAQFRGVEPCAQGSGFTGEVNGKNAYGGYAGYVEFIWIDGTAALAPTSTTPTRQTLAEAAPFIGLARRCYAPAIANEISASFTNLQNSIHELEQLRGY